ncbi:MAG: hydrogenase iron-sulfur subunit [Candidatus Heimdallarchaeota archaeon]|nr:MAG: hydrogenase iron-sulfur subunit [Candidatus Heimdallarchaeota archaeon]
MDNFEPKIIGILCDEGAYHALDEVGETRILYPSNIMIMRTQGTSYIATSTIIELFIQGVDGIFIGDCKVDDFECFLDDYYDVKIFIKILKKLMKYMGLNEDRLYFNYFSGSDVGRIVSEISDFTDEIKEIGPIATSMENPDISTLESLYAAKCILQNFKLKAVIGKRLELITSGNEYDSKKDQRDIDDLLNKIIDDEYKRIKILLLTWKKPQSVKDLALKLKIPKQMVLEHIVTLTDRGFIIQEKIVDHTKLYKADIQGM